jgi:hypothetical protein
MRREIIQSSGFATGTNRKLPGRTAGTRVGFARKQMRIDGQGECCTALNEPELNMLDFIDNNTIGFTGESRCSSNPKFVIPIFRDRPLS